MPASSSRASPFPTASTSRTPAGNINNSFLSSTTPRPDHGPPPPPRSSVAITQNEKDTQLSFELLDGLRRQSHLSTLSISPRRRRSSLSTFADGAKGKGKSSTTAKSRRFNDQDEEDEDESFQDREMLDDSNSHSRRLPETEEAGEEQEGEGWTMIDRMRNWRNDAMTQHLYSTAGFWGGKVYALTGNPNDAFWLAQTYFLTHQFAQAERLLTTPPPPLTGSTSSAPEDCSISFAYPSQSAATAATTTRRLTDSSLACRYLAAQCQVRLGKWEEALELVGRSSSIWSAATERDKASDGGIKLTASTAHLRGLIYLHLGSADLSKEAFMEALSRDVKCFESFESLVGGEMMTAEEEWHFVQGLEYGAQTGDDADFVRMMYTVRLKKVQHRPEVTIARNRLAEEFGLGDDPDVLFGLADELYTAMRFAECYQVTTRILSLHSSHRPTLPLHLSCMHHLPQLRSRLFLLAHEMVEHEPDDAISWYAVGLWYFSGRRWEESRRFFGKSVLIDSRFGPSWIAFAHSYAYEGEHDQAITAYSTAARHFQGTHLPYLFIGMQHLGLKNVALAEEYCQTAHAGGGERDAGVWNELGVIAYYKEDHALAIEHFTETLKWSKDVQGAPVAWATTHLNLGHAYRKLKRFSEAHAAYREVIRLDPRSAAAYSGLGVVEHHLGRFQESIARYHEALTLAPSDPITAQLLKLVLEDLSTSFTSALPPRTTLTSSNPSLPSSSSSLPLSRNGSSGGFLGLSHSVTTQLDIAVEELHEGILKGGVGRESSTTGVRRSRIAPPVSSSRSLSSHTTTTTTRTRQIERSSSAMLDETEEEEEELVEDDDEGAEGEEGQLSEEQSGSVAGGLDESWRSGEGEGEEQEETMDMD